METIESFRKNIKGDAVVEAAILFPIMIMIFAALVILSAYLPTRAALQRATQYAATVLATQDSDVWLFYDLHSMNFYWEIDKERLGSIYSLNNKKSGDIFVQAEKIVKEVDKQLASLRDGDLTIDCRVINKIILKEYSITATRRFTVPVNLTFIGFPEVIDITVTSTAISHDGDEFIRTIDLATDFSEYIKNKFELSNAGDAVSSFTSRFKAMIGR